MYVFDILKSLHLWAESLVKSMKSSTVLNELTKTLSSSCPSFSSTWPLVVSVTRSMLLPLALSLSSVDSSTLLGEDPISSACQCHCLCIVHDFFSGTTRHPRAGCQALPSLSSLASFPWSVCPLHLLAKFWAGGIRSNNWYAWKTTFAWNTKLTHLYK